MHQNPDGDSSDEDANLLDNIEVKKPKPAMLKSEIQKADDPVMIPMSSESLHMEQVRKTTPTLKQTNEESLFHIRTSIEHGITNMDDSVMYN